MANKRLTDLPEATSSVVGDVVAIDGATTRKITVENFLTPNLVAIKGLTSAANKGIQFTGAGTAAVYDLTAAGKALLDDADTVAQRTTLGLVIGTDVQAQDADLSALAANSADGLWAHTGAGTGAARTLTAPAAGITITNPAGIAGNPTLVLANDLAAVEGLASTGIARRTGTDTWTVGTAVANAELATMAAYTIKGNATGSSAVPTDIDITALTSKPSPVSGDIVLIQDSAASNAFKKTTVGALSSAGSVASIAGNTGAFTLGAGLTNATNVLLVNAGHVPGIATNTAASAGEVGEYISSTVLTGAAVALVNSTAKDVTTVSLTAGEWECQAVIDWTGTGTLTNARSWISLTANTQPTVPNSGAFAAWSGSVVGPQTSNPGPILPTGAIRFSLSGTTTVSLGSLAIFSGSISAYGFIGCRRMR